MIKKNGNARVDLLSELIHQYQDVKTLPRSWNAFLWSRFWCTMQSISKSNGSLMMCLRHCWEMSNLPKGIAQPTIFFVPNLTPADVTDRLEHINHPSPPKPEQCWTSTNPNGISGADWLQEKNTSIGWQSAVKRTAKQILMCTIYITKTGRPSQSAGFYINYSNFKAQLVPIDIVSGNVLPPSITI